MTEGVRVGHGEQVSPAPAGERGACARGGAVAVTFMKAWALNLERGSDEANGFVSPANTWNQSVPWVTFESTDRSSWHAAVGAVF